MESANEDRMPEIKLVAWGKYDYDTERFRKEKGLEPIQYDCSVVSPREHQLMEKMLIDELVRKKYCFSGESHQRKLFCTPIFEVDGKRVYFTASWRAWGGIMAEARTIVDNQSYDYMDFYMDCFLKDQPDPNYKIPMIDEDIDENGECLN